MITESRDPKTGVLLFEEDQDSIDIRKLTEKYERLEERFEELESKYSELIKLIK